MVVRGLHLVAKGNWTTIVGLKHQLHPWYIFTLLLKHKALCCFISRTEHLFQRATSLTEAYGETMRAAAVWGYCRHLWFYLMFLPLLPSLIFFFFSQIRATYSSLQLPQSYLAQLLSKGEQTFRNPLALLVRWFVSETKTYCTNTAVVVLISMRNMFKWTEYFLVRHTRLKYMGHCCLL